jgi:hypothetical protein
MRILISLAVLLTCFALVSVFAGEKVNFSGEWTINEGKCVLDDMGTQFLPVKLQIAQKENDFAMEKTYTGMEGQDFTDKENLTLDGKECKSTVWNSSPRTTTANWSAGKDTLNIATVFTFTGQDGNESEIKINEHWSLQEDGKALAIDHTSNSTWGERKVKLVFDKKSTEDAEK